MSLKGIKPEIVTKQIKSDVNHIAWIVGHCVSHMDLYLSIFNKERKLSNDQRKYHAYGVSKEEVIEFPFSFRELLDPYLNLSSEFMNKLYELSEDDFLNISYEENGEPLYQLIQRITLHYMGHAGQIVLLRRQLDDPFWSFVGGVNKKQREKLLISWKKWWKENSNSYS